MFKDGLIGFVVEVLINQFTTFVGAFMWFTYWPDENGGFIVWIAIAYAGYMLGLNLARQEIPAATNLMEVDWRSRLRTAFRPQRNQDPRDTDKISR